MADEAHGVAADKFGNIIVVGSIHNDSTNADMHIVKYDPDGRILWTRTYSNGMEDVGEFAYGVATDSKGNIIVTGRGTSVGHFPNYVTLKYDSSGNFIWMREYDGGWTDIARDVAVDDSDNVIVTGYSNGDMNWDWCTIKYSPDGDTIWVRRHNVALDDKADGVTCDKDGNVIVVGRLGQSPTKYAAIVKYSPAGDTLWTKLFVRPVPLDGLMNFVDVVTDECENIYTVGLFVLWDNGKDWRDYYVVKCNPQGDTVWTARYDLNLQDEPKGIALDTEDNIIITGTTSANPSLYQFDYFTVKLHNVTNGVAEENFAPHHFSLHPNYPNPFNASTVISYQLPVRSFVSLKVFDLLGREIETLVAEEKSAGTYTATWNARNFSSGIYFFRLQAGDFTAVKKCVKLK
ncbi:MAG: T9SS type A sorting domain-containing protein [archaeon]